MPWLLVLLVFAGLAGGAVVVARTDWKNWPNAARYVPLLNSAELRHAIPRDLLARLAWQESRFRTDIVTGATQSAAGAQGIMQIVPKWHPGIDPLNVPAAIDYAGKYLRSQYDRFRSWPLALAAYNAGPTVVADFRDGTNKSGRNPKLERTGGMPPFRETKEYVASITRDVGLA